MKYSQERQFERYARRRVAAAVREGSSTVDALQGAAFRKTIRDDFKPRSHGWCGSHNRNTRADSGTRQRGYPRKLYTTHWVSVGGGK